MISNQTAIRVEELGKRYRLGLTHDRSLRHLADRCINRLLGRNPVFTGKVARRNPEGDPNWGQRTGNFWALQDISFQLERGEVLGIIGHNGSGKSTLLKILSRVTCPTTGRAMIAGRVASMLEVGTGFHPELTGRENIFLNGVIMGMSRREIRAKFDEIVDFSGVEQFIDTPVKRYSSGMKVRLGFAVAAHLEPDVMVIDEVLAVGDLQFQQKCLGKMGDAVADGRTVLFVSHNMEAIRQLCPRTIWLSAGEIVQDGDSHNVVSNYIASNTQELRSVDLGQAIAKLHLDHPDPTVELEKIEISQNGSTQTRLASGEATDIQIAFSLFAPAIGLQICIELQDENGTVLMESFHYGDKAELPVDPAGRYVSTATIPADSLCENHYRLHFKFGIYNVRNFNWELAVPISVYNTSSLNCGYPGHRTKALLAPRIGWSTKMLDV